MNLYFRLLRVLLAAFFGKRIEPPFGVSSIHFRTLPHDCDLNWHINNGRYLTMMDLGRLDMMIRMGIGKLIWQRKWAPMLSSAQIVFRREIRIWKRFELRTRIVAWEGTSFVMEHRFIGPTPSGEMATVAVSRVRGGFYVRKERRFVPVSEVVEALGLERLAPPEMTPDVQAFLHSGDHIKDVARADYSI